MAENNYRNEGYLTLLIPIKLSLLYGTLLMENVLAAIKLLVEKALRIDLVT